jgi:hypothetical protein
VPQKEKQGLREKGSEKNLDKYARQKTPLPFKGRG